MLFSLLISLISCTRYTRKKEKQVNCTHLLKTQVNTWIAQHPNCVVVYSDSEKIMKPLKQAVDDNSDFASFAISEPNPETNPYCVAYPCASAYLNGRHVRSTISDLSPIDFQFWVTHTLSEPHFDIVHPEELRRLLKLPGNHFFAINIDKRPNWIPKDQVLFHVSEQHMNALNLRVQTGIYLFRSVDREFLELRSWDTSLFKTELFEIGVDRLQSKPYLAMVMIEHGSTESDHNKFVLMKTLAQKPIGAKMHFTAIADSLAGHMAQACQFTHICGPLFLIVKTNNVTGGHWGITTDTFDPDPSLLEEYAQKVATGNEKALISEITPDKDQFAVIHLTALNFDENVMSNNHHSLVMITSSCVGLSFDGRAIMHNGVKYFQGKGLYLYQFDEGHNDNPHGQEPFESLPVFKLYKKGSKEPIIFKKQLTLPNLLKFINQNTGIVLSEDEKTCYQQDILMHLDQFDDGAEYVDYDAKLDL